MEHHFNVEEAKKYGIEAAILIYNIRFWILKNKANKTNFINGKYWTFNSAKAFSELFPYMSSQKIARELRKLEYLGLIESDVLSENKYDKTKWYTLKNDLLSNEKSNVQNENIDYSKLNNGVLKNEQYISDNKQQIINTDNKLNIIYSFDEFWSLYPKKISKEKCKQVYSKLSLTEMQKIRETLPKFLKYKPFDTYTHPNPLTYLNQKRWDDEITEKDANVVKFQKRAL